MSAKLTPKQLENAMTYGVCRVCKAPREPRTTQTVVRGETAVTRSIVCPNGHPQ